MGIGIARDETGLEHEKYCRECGAEMPGVSYGFSRPELTSFCVGDKKGKRRAEKIAKERREWVQSLFDRRVCEACGWSKDDKGE